MRTKALLLTAAISAVGVASSMAQTAVYSVNIVGYINKTLPAGLSLVANQLNATPNNSIQTLFANPGPLTINKFNPATGSFDQAIFDPDAGGWNDPKNITMAPGSGAFIDNPQGAPVTVTFVGEVQLSSSLNVHPGLDVYSSVVPQSGPLDTLGFPNPPPNPLTVFKYNTTSHGFDSFIYDPDAGGWNPSLPSVNVSDAFFLDNPGTAFAWPRTFAVGP